MVALWHFLRCIVGVHKKQWEVVGASAVRAKTCRQSASQSLSSLSIIIIVIIIITSLLFVSFIIMTALSP